MNDSFTKTRIRKITRRFDLTLLKFRWMSSVYRKKAMIRIQTKAGPYALKPYFGSPLIRKTVIQQIKTTASHIKLLMENDYSYMPKWLYANNGNLWVMNKGKPFYISEWISGRGLLESADYEHLGRVIATLHHTLNSLLPNHQSDVFTLKQLQLWKHSELRFYRDKDGARRKNAKYRRWYKRYGGDCRILSDRSWNELKDPEIVDLLHQESARPTLIHGDITSPNVIISDEGRLHIIDWDRVRIGSFYVELAKTLMNTTQYRPEFIQSLLKGYEEIRPLTRAERRLIAALFRFPIDAWKTARFPTRKSSSEHVGTMDKTWSLRMKATDYMNEWANQ